MNKRPHLKFRCFSLKASGWMTDRSERPAHDLRDRRDRPDPNATVDSSGAVWMLELTLDLDPFGLLKMSFDAWCQVIVGSIERSVRLGVCWSTRARTARSGFSLLLPVLLSVNIPASDFAAAAWALSLSPSISVWLQVSNLSHKEWQVARRAAPETGPSLWLKWDITDWKICRVSTF